MLLKLRAIANNQIFSFFCCICIAESVGLNHRLWALNHWTPHKLLLSRLAHFLMRPLSQQPSQHRPTLLTITPVVVLLTLIHWWHQRRLTDISRANLYFRTARVSPHWSIQYLVQLSSTYQLRHRSVGHWPNTNTIK